MLPVCYEKDLMEKLEYDLNWFDFDSSTKQLKETSQKKNYLSLSRLVLNKRKRSGSQSLIILITLM